MTTAAAASTRLSRASQGLARSLPLTCGVSADRAPRYPDAAKAGSNRCFALSSSRLRLIAALISDRCVKACGKLPSCPPVESISSENRPRWLPYVNIFSNVSTASSSRPALARASTYRNVQSENVPSSPCRPSGKPPVVPVDQAVRDQFLVHGIQGGQPPRLYRRDEVLDRHEQQRGVQHIRVVVLGKRLDLVVPAASHDLVVQL